MTTKIRLEKKDLVGEYFFSYQQDNDFWSETKGGKNRKCATKLSFVTQTDMLSFRSMDLKRALYHREEKYEVVTLIYPDITVKLTGLRLMPMYQSIMADFCILVMEKMTYNKEDGIEKEVQGIKSMEFLKQKDE